MNEKINSFKIDAADRQSWQSIAMVWAGSMICVSSLMIGGILVGGGLSILEIILSIIIGYSMICVYMILIGMQSCDTGLPVSVMAAGSLGKSGSKYVISALLAIACIGWFGIQSAVCGSSFSSMILNMTGLDIPVWISSIIWGGIMLTTACSGFKGLKFLNYAAVPTLLFVCIYGVISAVSGNNGMELLKSYSPTESYGLVFGISMVVASFALGGVISGDYCRFAKSRKDVVKSSILGVLPAGLFMLLIGAILSIITGQYDITSILASIGMPILGLIALVLATWTTNVSNAYSGGLALSNLLGLNESHFKITTAIAGGLGTILAAAGLLNQFQSFLSLLSALIPPLAGVIIADYWIIGKGNKKNFIIRENLFLPGIISFIIGSFIACLTGGTFEQFPILHSLSFPFFIGPINGIITSFILYCTIYKLSNNTLKQQKEYNSLEA